MKEYSIILLKRPPHCKLFYKARNSMNVNDFNAPEAGKVVLTPQGFHAFIPAKLPPQLEFNADLVKLLSKADAALSELSGLGPIHVI